MIADKIPEIKNLSAEDKLTLATELWDELDLVPDLFPVRADHVQLLEERLAAHERNPQDVISWEDLKNRLLGSR